MPYSKTTLPEVAEALESAGVGLYVYEGRRGRRSWLAGAALFDGHRSIDAQEHLIRISDSADGSPRFLGVLRGGQSARRTPGKGARYHGRAGLQAMMTDLADSLDPSTPVAICVFGLHELREFCRSYGYDVGDVLAREVGLSIAHTLPENTVFTRFSGAKFAAAIVDMDEDRLQDRLDSICEDLSAQEFDVGFGPVSVTVSVGAAIARGDAIATPTPFEAAMTALDEAINGSVGRTYLAAPVTAAPDAESMREGAREIMHALRDETLTVAYQAVVQADDPNRLAFRECLARLPRADGSWAPAAAFMPKIERLDLVRSVDERSLSLALRTLAARPTERLSVNISVRTLNDRLWLRALMEAAEADPALPQRLIVELTESTAVLDPGATRAFLDDIRALGVSIALDDFGAGYSSFRHVRDFRPDWVKIDGTFSLGVASNADNQLFVDTLVGIARNFDMATVAEFVETEADAQTLRELGVDCLQGYLYGRPEVNPDWPEEALRPAI